MRIIPPAQRRRYPNAIERLSMTLTLRPTTPPAHRQPVSVQFTGDIIQVVCEDGTLWHYSPRTGWKQYPPIPFTADL
jgi:hypothetical protein